VSIVVSREKEAGGMGEALSREAWMAREVEAVRREGYWYGVPGARAWDKAGPGRGGREGGSRAGQEEEEEEEERRSESERE
jgi:hypothetical protein